MVPVMVTLDRAMLCGGEISGRGDPLHDVT